MGDAAYSRDKARMALIYQAACKHCGKCAGEELDEGMAVLTPSGELRALGSPGEERDLKAMGYTWAGVGLTGRFVRLKTLVCLECGRPSVRGKICVPFEAGCGPWLLMIFAGLVLTTVLGAPSVAQAALFITGTFIFVFGILPLLVRLVFAWRLLPASIERGPCRNCGGTQFGTLNAVATEDNGFPCAACGEKARVYKRWGMT